MEEAARPLGKAIDVNSLDELKSKDSLPDGAEEPYDSHEPRIGADGHRTLHQEIR